MSIAIPVPDDATHDYVPTEGSRVQVGTDLLACWTVRGQLTSVFAPPDPDGLWALFMITTNPDDTTQTGTAVYPAQPASMPSDWWHRMAIWRRTAKLSDGSIVTATDGSKWIYPAGGDGRMRCYQTGSTFARGDQRFRGQLSTDPKDLWVCDDSQWDWIPITDGSQVAVGDTITFLMTSAADVDSITVTDTSYYRRHAFIDTDDGAFLGWWDEIVYQSAPFAVLNTWTFFERLPKPAADAKFSSSDGSRWIYVGASRYYCWSAGAQYAAGALFLRGEIAGGLTPIT